MWVLQLLLVFHLFLEIVLPKKPSVLSMNGGHPDVIYTNDGFQTVGTKKKRKCKSKSTNAGQFTGPSVKNNVRYEPKATTTAPKKGATYVEEDDKEDVEIVHDESVDLNINTGGSLSFTAAAGGVERVFVWAEEVGMAYGPVGAKGGVVTRGG
nr:hypothetical protein [Tanacetum cinerariifolium]